MAGLEQRRAHLRAIEHRLDVLVSAAARRRVRRLREVRRDATADDRRRARSDARTYARSASATDDIVATSVHAVMKRVTKDERVEVDVSDGDMAVPLGPRRFAGARAASIAAASRGLACLKRRGERTGLWRASARTVADRPRRASRAGSRSGSSRRRRRAGRSRRRPTPRSGSPSPARGCPPRSRRRGSTPAVHTWIAAFARPSISFGSTVWRSVTAWMMNATAKPSLSSWWPARYEQRRASAVRERDEQRGRQLRAEHAMIVAAHADRSRERPRDQRAAERADAAHRDDHAERRLATARACAGRTACRAR